MHRFVVNHEPLYRQPIALSLNTVSRDSQSESLIIHTDRSAALQAHAPPIEALLGSSPQDVPRRKEHDHQAGEESDTGRFAEGFQTPGAGDTRPST